MLIGDLSRIKLNGVVYNLKDAQARDLLALIEEESMANVKAMLAKYGLNTTTVYTEPNTDTAAAGATVLAE